MLLIWEDNDGNEIHRRQITIGVKLVGTQFRGMRPTAIYIAPQELCDYIQLNPIPRVQAYLERLTHAIRRGPV